MTHLPDLQTSISQAIQQLKSIGSQSAWKYSIGLEPAANPSPVSLPYTWSSADGIAWFETDVWLPDRFENLPIAGSPITFEFFLTIGARIQVNGVDVCQEPFWTDSRAARLPIPAPETGEPLRIQISCNPTDGFGLFVSSTLHLDAIDQTLFALDTVQAQLRFANYLASLRPELQPALELAAVHLNLEALEQRDWDAWNRGAALFSSALAASFDAYAKEFTTCLIGHSHIDMNWLWPWQETLSVLQRDFVAADGLMERFPDFIFSQSQAAVYEAVERQFPELFEKIKKRVAQGRWELTANTWVEGDLNLSLGETLTRHLLLSRRYLTEKFSKHALTLWEPDTFGHSANIPQLMVKSGLRNYYFCRAGKKEPLFLWEGIDGSRVLATQDPFGYMGEVTPSAIVESAITFHSQSGVKDSYFVYGVGNHGGGATALDLEAAAAICAMPGLPQTQPARIDEFFERVAPYADQLPVVRGELNSVFEGCYTSHSDIKKLNRAGETTLLSAESAGVAARIHGIQPSVRLENAWKEVCFHQFHDILDGCAIGVTYREAVEKLAPVIGAADDLSLQSVTAMAAETDTRDLCGPGFLVFNPLGFERTDVVKINLEHLGDLPIPDALRDESGRILPVQVTDHTLVFVAENVPAYGSRLYCAASGNFFTPETPSDNLTIENDYLRLSVHPESGCITHLVDLESGVDFSGLSNSWGTEAPLLYGNFNRMEIAWEMPHPMSAWNIGDIRRVDALLDSVLLEHIENGPVRNVIRIHRQFLNSTLEQDVILYNGIPRVDFETRVHWAEKGAGHSDAPMLRATFTPGFNQDCEVACEVPFGVVSKTADGREVAALRWIDLSQKDGGLGLTLMNDCKYGHSVKGHTLNITLLRSSYEPDHSPDVGDHQFTYSVYPHLGDWKTAGANRMAEGVNQPLIGVVAQPHPGRIQSGAPLVQLSAPNIQISALKQAVDDHAVILRLVELFGETSSFELSLGFPVKVVQEVDLIETPIAPLDHQNGVLRLTMSPYEIKTLRISL